MRRRGRLITMFIYWFSQKMDLHSIMGPDIRSGCDGRVYFFINGNWAAIMRDEVY